MFFKDEKFSNEVFSGFRQPQNVFDFLKYIDCKLLGDLLTKNRLSLISLSFGMRLFAVLLHSRAYAADFFG